MSFSARRIPSLTVETSRVDNVSDLMPLLDAHDPQLWWRSGEGFAAIGQAARLEFSGPTRIHDAADAWRQLCAHATVSDAVRMPGTGLVALGAFTFSPMSEYTSVLIVPRIVVGVRDGVGWVTRITRDGESFALPASTLPKAVALGQRPSVAFRDGHLSTAGYRDVVERAVTALRAGPVRKVVLARDIEGRIAPRADVRATLGALADAYPDCWTYCVDGLMGTSPETLVKVDSGTVRSRVLAGTLERGATDAEDAAARDALAASRKDRAEHAYAVTSVVQSLGRHCVNVDAARQPFTLAVPNVWHLATDVTADLSGDASALDLVAALHPTAAVGGTPTAQAMALLESLEPFDRGRYAGPVGWVSAEGDGEWAIALRAAEVSPLRTVRAFAGGGIVDHSDPDAELAETTAKFRPIVEAFG